MKKLNIAVIAPVLALKPKKTAKAAQPRKPAAKAEDAKNTDALEAPHAVKGKPHHFQYK